VPDERFHSTWLSSDRFIPARFLRPVLHFTQVEAAGGLVLLGATAAALVWANLPFTDSYESFWQTRFDVIVGPFTLYETLRGLVNDGLMALFFFVVGLEIKRELVHGELRDPKTAALPVVAAVGGMVVPALIYLAFAGGTASHGWAVPVATDIAFSLGVLALLSKRVPVGARLFLLTLAIADDIGGIVVIAIGYTGHVEIWWLLGAIAALTTVWAAGRAGVRSTTFYGLAAALSWLCLLESGVHAAITGVALALLTPAAALYGDDQYRDRARRILSRHEHQAAAPFASERIDAEALILSAIARESVAPLDRMERALHPWSSFAVVPVFALANAGVHFADRPSDEWRQVNAAAGEHSGSAPALFDQLLGRIRAPLIFATVADGGQTASVGMAVAEAGRVGLFEIGTHPAHRRRGLARRVVGALLAWGAAQGATGAYLQVMPDNIPALALYQGLGFGEAYRYWYRVAPAPVTGDG